MVVVFFLHGFISFDEDYFGYYFFYFCLIFDDGEVVFVAHYLESCLRVMVLVLMVDREPFVHFSSHYYKLPFFLECVHLHILPEGL